MQESHIFVFLAEEVSRARSKWSRRQRFAAGNCYWYYNWIYHWLIARYQLIEPISIKKNFRYVHRMKKQTDKQTNIY